MLRDAGNVTPGVAIETDVCIVGAGPVGITMALELARSKLRVLLVEAGAAQPEIRSPALRGSSEGWSYPALEDTRARGLGGTAATWSARARWSPHSSMSSHPLDPIDSEARSWVPHSGWAIGLEQLQPFYARAQAVCGLGPVDDEIDCFPEDEAWAPLAARSISVQTTLMRFAEPDWVDGHRATLAQATNLTLLLHAQAVEVESQGPGHVSALKLRTPAGVVSVAAKAYVLAGGGIENARLLLLSDSTYPAGLGNGNDVVGRYFMDHLVLNHGIISGVGTDFLRRVQLYRRHDRDGVPVLGNLRLTEEVLRREQLLGVQLSPFVGRRPFFSEGVRSLATLVASMQAGRLPRRVGATLGAMARQPVDVASAGYLALRGADLAEPSFFGLLPHVEQAPRPENRVTLSDQRDELGLRRAHLSWRVGDMEEHSLRRTYEIIADELAAEGRARLQHGLSSDAFRRLTHVAHHHIGTTRMHADPKHGVVDADCRVHGISNLYVAGASVMPTGGAATVTLTAMALAIRLADHLQSELEAALAEL